MLAKLTIKEGQHAEGTYFLDVMTAAQLLAQLAESGTNFIPLNGLVKYLDNEDAVYRRIEVGKELDFTVELADENEVPGHKE